MSELTTICFIGTAEQKALLKRWAKEDERSVSYIMRQILTREAQRREQPESNSTQNLTQKFPTGNVQQVSNE